MIIVFQQLARAKLEVKKREDMIKEKQQFMESEIDNNTELEKKIAIAERASARIHMEHQEAETQRIQFQDEASCTDIDKDTTRLRQ